MKVGLLLIGDELLSGLRQDKHLAQVLGFLKARGLPLAWVRMVGDDWDLLVDTLKQTFATPEIVFSFGPDDEKSKEYIKQKLDFEATIFDSKISLWEFTKYLSTSLVFVSTSTGPMHLAGATNTTTLSFFGNTLFASNKRWATISEQKFQNNFMLDSNYSKDEYKRIENRLKEILDVK